jgi:O-antigen/teichoic acid export membrane protein
MSFNRIVSGAFVSYLNTAFSLISNLILIPMYLFYFGKEEYGLWLVVLSIVNYLGFSNFGIAQSVANLVASANAKSNFNEINIIAATGFWLYACIIFVIMVIVCGGLFVVEIEDFLNIPDSLKNVVIPVLVISSASFLLKLPLTIFNVTLRSLNLIYKEQLFGLVFTIIQTMGVVVILLSGTGIVGLSIVYGLTGLLSSLVLGLYLYKFIPGFSISRKFVSRKMVGRLIDPGIYFFLLQIGGAFIAGTDNIVITANIGVAEVASYAVAFQVCYIATRLISVITASALPSITSIYASNDRDHLSIVYIQILRSCFGFGLLLFLFCLALAQA